MRRKLLLLTTFVLLFILPVIGSFIKWGDFPPGYGLFPAQQVTPDAPFSPIYFLFGCLVALVILIFLLFPTVFGFKKLPPSPPNTKQVVDYPKWFRPALIILFISWIFMWGRFDGVKPFDHYTFVPLWWAFIFVLDAIVYKRNGGYSLFSSPKGRVTMKLLAITSSFSWFVFEFQNFFVLENWYYPNNTVFTNFGNIAWQLLSYTTVLPAVFEWYWLLRTFDSLSRKYAYGPVIRFPLKVLYIFLFAGLLLSLLMAIFPQELFWALWIGLIPALAPAMVISKFWNPFTPIGTRGDWSPLVLVAIATLLNGFFWEFWNFGSEWFHPNWPTNPNYWRYSVPYLDYIHIFSAMPVLGYFGYLFFGIGCWLLWNTIAHLAGFSPAIHNKDRTEEVTAQA